MKNDIYIYGMSEKNERKKRKEYIYIYMIKLKSWFNDKLVNDKKLKMKKRESVKSRTVLIILYQPCGRVDRNGRANATWPLFRELACTRDDVGIPSTIDGSMSRIMRKSSSIPICTRTRCSCSCCSWRSISSSFCRCSEIDEQLIVRMADLTAVPMCEHVHEQFESWT